LQDRENHDSALYQLVVYDIATGSSRIVEQFWRTAWTLMPGSESFDGPYLTLDGNAYYVSTSVRGLTEGDPDDIRRSRVFETKHLPLVSSKSALDALESSHLQVWGESGLYLVSWAGTDSTLLCRQQFSQVARLRVAASADGSLVFNHGKLVRRLLGDTIDVREYAGSLPPNTHSCSFLDVSFNPRREELLFQHYCEGDDPYVVFRAATFDVATLTFALLDTLAGIDNCEFPAYAPNGRMIALLSSNRGYIVWREDPK
jgi:hypothetical protein